MIKSKVCPSTNVLLPTLDEAEGIGPTISELKSHLIKPNIIVIDGRSQDRTVEIANKMGANVYYQEGIGKGDAIKKGIENVDFDKCKYVIFIDADYTYPAEYLPFMIRILEKNSDVGMVCGNRFSQVIYRKTLDRVFYCGNQILSLFHRVVNEVVMSDPLTGLRVVRSSTLKDWIVKSKGFGVEVELNNYIDKKGYKIVEFPIKYRIRLGKKKLKISDGFLIFIRMFLELISKN